MQKFEHTIEELKDLTKENFENQDYTISSIEETMGLRLSQLVGDIPAGQETLDAIFSLNPFK